MKHHQKTISPRAGFTLVELITVMVILALLLAAAVPAMTQWIRKGNISAAKTDCRACVVTAQTIAVEKYTAEKSTGLVDAWIGDAAARGRDIAAQTGVKGTVAADRSAGDGRGVEFDPSRGYTVTYLRYYYTDTDYVYYENGEIREGPEDETALPEDETALPAPVPSPTANPTAAPVPTPTAPPPSATPEPGGWPQEKDFDANGNYDFYAGEVIVWHGNTYIITRDYTIYKSNAVNGPDAVLSWDFLEKLTGVHWDQYNTEGHISANQLVDVVNGDLYTDDTGTYVYTPNGGGYGNLPPASHPGAWFRVS